MKMFGVDIGGSGIKGAPVDLGQGKLLSKRHRIPTPQPATPQIIADIVAEVVRHFDYRGPLGCTFPAIMKEGVAHSAANVDQAWIGTSAKRLFEQTTGCPVVVINDADAAGIAEMHYGAGKGHQGVVLVVTLGTGIGSALFVRGTLVPNTEFGHLEFRGQDAEDWASDRIREAEKLSYKQWASRVNAYLNHLEMLFSPDLFIIGGGVSKHFDKYAEHLHLKTPVVPAALRNEAGIVGAAFAARSMSQL